MAVRHAGALAEDGERVSISMVPSCSHQVLCLNLAGTHVTLLCALLDLGDQGLFLPLKLSSQLIKLTYSLVQHALVLAQALRRRHALSKGPFEDL